MNPLLIVILAIGLFPKGTTQSCAGVTNIKHWQTIFKLRNEIISSGKIKRIQRMSVVQTLRKIMTNRISINTIV